MDEYISRKDAIKELRDVYEYEYPTASGDFDEYASHDVPNVLRNMKAADVQPVNQWISVKDRLPNEDDCYLVVIESEICVSIDIAEYSENRWHKHDKVLYWQPLPEPPKDGDAE